MAVAMSTTVGAKERAHEIIESLPDEMMAEALELLEDLARPRFTVYTAHLAPIDDEEETEQERRDVEEARAARARGEGITHDELMRRVRERRCGGK